MSATGNNLVFALKKNGNAWGVDRGAVCAAGDQLDVNSETLSLDAQLIEHVALSGQGTALPSRLGEKLVAGDVPTPLTWRGCETAVALNMGTAGTPAQQGGTAAYAHTFLLANDLSGIHGTISMSGSNHPAVREIEFAKASGLTFDFQRNSEALLTHNWTGFDLAANIGAPTAAGVVAAVDIADVTYTILAQPTEVGYLTVLIVDGDTSVTEHIVTFTGTDIDGNAATEILTLSDQLPTLTYTTKTKWAGSGDIVIVGSGSAGEAPGDTIQIGHLPGENNDTTVASIALPTSADFQVCGFDQVHVWANEQDAGALTLVEDAADELYVDAVRVSLQPSMSQNVTTRHGRRIDEPHATDNRKVEIGLNHPNWDARNHALWKGRSLSTRYKMHIRLRGPEADTGFPLEWSIWLNNVQFGAGTANAGGPGDMRFDLTGMAHRTLTSPTGIPAWANLQPMSLYNINLRTTDPLA